ncbi:hypothetical protein CG003_02460 [Mesoplasma florum]|uniref:Arabinogalactan endo-beta-1,4-galactanase n=1 Tax=Mesoplasma florum TaxID=2151 RepID=A0A2R3P7P7_MESFO|nr:glycosyl hydrolase 53 family protein [Mesoplasma florum]AVN64512.1 hypothetical protein CG003_02460 [Mesoplasma florum]
MGKNEEQLTDLVHDYAYSSIEKFYNETEIMPFRIQVDNEATRISFWDSKNESKTRKNYMYTSNIMKGGFQAIDKFNLAHQNEKNIIKVLHLDGIVALSKWKSVLNEYLLKNNLINYVDEIGITSYLEWWQGSEHLFDIITMIKKEYGLNSSVSETSNMFTMNETNLSGDLENSQHEKNEYSEVPVSATQITMINSMMEAASKASPNYQTGIYWWEPAWLLTNGKISWTTKEGIVYCESNNQQNQKLFMTGNT